MRAGWCGGVGADVHLAARVGQAQRTNSLGDRLAERLGGLLAALGQGQCRIRVFLFGGLGAGRALIGIMPG